MDEMLQGILPDFIVESSELIEKLDQNFLELEENPSNLEILNEIFRYAHTIKGSSSIFDFTQMSSLAHRMENVLDRMRKEELHTTGTIIDVMLQSLDILKQLLEDIKNDTLQDRDIATVIALLDKINAGEDVATELENARDESPAKGAEDTAPATGAKQETVVETPAKNDDTSAAKDIDASAEQDAVDAALQSEMDEMMKEVLPEFINEASELLDQLDSDFVELEQRPEDLELLNGIFRAAHTIKGSSSMFGFGAISDLSHKMENVLDRLRKEELTVVPVMADVLLASVDKLKEMLDDVRNNGAVGEHDTTDLITQLKQYNDMKAGDAVEELTPAAETPAAEVASFVAETEAPQKKTSIMQQIREQASLEKEGTEKSVKDTPEPSDNVASKKPALKIVEQKPAKKRGMTITETTSPKAKACTSPPKSAGAEKDKKEVKKPKESQPSPVSDKPKKAAPKGLVIQEVTKGRGGATATATATRTSTRTVDPTIRVNISRLDNLMNLAGELILGRNRLLQISKDMKGKMQSDKETDQLTDLSAQIDLLTTDIQMAIMKTRMLSVQHIFSKFPRMIRDLSRKKRKKIDLVISGEETELDKSVLEDINDPLVHIIRNSIDHGIESPEEREAAGKPATGTVKISAYHEGNHIVIKIEDDGKGMDVQKIASKAVEKGVIKQDDADIMSKRELLNLIFAPGFSTAEQVSDISGRGVGMDVVRTNIEKMKGTIDLATEVGKGTIIHIKIPLTLAIIQALLVRVADEIYAIPVLSITEIVRLNKDEVDTVYGQEVIRLREDVFPIVRLTKLFEFEEQNDSNDFIIMVSLAEQKFGLVVNSLIGEQEVVVKPLGNYLGKSRGLAGASIMGDGRVCLILDIGSLAELINEQKKKSRKKVS